MIQEIKKNEPIELIVIDSDSFVVVIINMLFDLETVEDIGFISFDTSANALEYLEHCTEKLPKIIIFELIDKCGLHDYTFLEQYPLLKRNDFVYILTVSIDNRDQFKCMSYDFVKKYITKPIDITNIRDLINELGLIRKK